jgi:hypothetical protein
METRTVHYGDTSVKISSFRSYKAFVAGDILGSASEQINELIEDYNSFRKEYREKNTVELTKTEALAAGIIIPEEEWGDSPTITLPQRPDGHEIFFRLFPKAKRLARTELIQLLGLVVVPNAELEAADGEDDDDAVPALLERHGKQILFAADLKETLQLVEVAVEVTKEQLEDLSDIVGKIQDLFNPVEEQPPEATEVSKEHTAPSVEVIRSGGSPTDPGSSTSSPPSTTGAEETSTSVSAGES